MFVNELIEKLYRLSVKNYRVVVEDEIGFLGLDIVNLSRQLIGPSNEHVIVITIERK